jgi:hypothetical protein
MVSPRTLVTALLFIAALPAGATTFCCHDDNGRRVCGDILPSQCFHKAYQEFNAQGTMVKQYDGPLTPEQRAKKEADLARKKEEDRKAKELDRQDRALLASYTSVRDIELKRDRMIADLEGSIHLAEDRLAEARARQQKTQQIATGYGDKPIPEPLKMQMRRNDTDVATQEAAIASKTQDIADLRKRFEDDRQRYLELTRKATENPTGAIPPPKPAAPTPPASSSTGR